MRLIDKQHYPTAKIGEIVALDGLNYRVANTQGENLILLYTPKGTAKHSYQQIQKALLTEEQINTEENKRELVAEMEYEEPED